MDYDDYVVRTTPITTWINVSVLFLHLLSVYIQKHLQIVCKNCRGALQHAIFRYLSVKMLYCPPNVTLSDIWINHGTSQCFMETVSISMIAGFLFIVGTVQLWMYRKYGTEISPNQLSRSKLYYTQIFFTYLIPLLEIIRFALQATILNDKQIYGYMVSTCSASFVLCLWLMNLSVWISAMCQSFLLYYSCILFNRNLQKVLINAKHCLLLTLHEEIFTFFLKHSHAFDYNLLEEDCAKHNL